MRKFIAFDGKHWNHDIFFRGTRRTAWKEMQETDRKSRLDTRRIATRAWAVKNEICDFAKKIFAEMQMMISSASKVSDATTRRVMRKVL